MKNVYEHECFTRTLRHVRTYGVLVMTPCRNTRSDSLSVSITLDCVDFPRLCRLTSTVSINLNWDSEALLGTSCDHEWGSAVPVRSNPRP